jgi:ssDNA-binding Zn-finger/Zn-ribbon topoisomerase 1
MSDSSSPLLPHCGKNMRQRTARKGKHAGQSFWGCSGYPECKGIREMSGKSDRSDESDKGPNP